MVASAPPESADGGRPAIPGDGERSAAPAPAPARPREASHPAKSTKPRNKNGLGGDADATLPPSTTD